MALSNETSEQSGGFDAFITGALGLGAAIERASDSLRLDQEVVSRESSAEMGRVLALIPDPQSVGPIPSTSVRASRYLTQLSNAYDETMRSVKNTLTDRVQALISNPAVDAASSVPDLASVATLSADPSATGVGGALMEAYGDLKMLHPSVDIPETVDSAKQARRALLARLAAAVPQCLYELHPKRDIKSQIQSDIHLENWDQVLFDNGTSATLIAPTRSTIGSGQIDTAPVNTVGHDYSRVYMQRSSDTATPELTFTGANSWTATFRVMCLGYSLAGCTYSVLKNGVVIPGSQQVVGAAATVAFSFPVSVQAGDVITLAATDVIATSLLGLNMVPLIVSPSHSNTGLVDETGNLVDESELGSLVGRVRGSVHNVFSRDSLELLSEVSNRYASMTSYTAAGVVDALITKLNYVPSTLLPEESNPFDPDFFFSSSGWLKLESGLTATQCKNLYKAWVNQLSLVILCSLVSVYGNV
jgi:hypothetical protein